MNTKLIREVKKNFMGKKITKEGNSKFWGTDDLHEHCLRVLNGMSIEDKFRFLMEHGVIEGDEDDDDPHMDKPNTED